MKNRLSLLEAELMELKEHILTHISTSRNMSFLRDQFSQIRPQLKMSVDELNGDTEKLVQGSRTRCNADEEHISLFTATHTPHTPQRCVISPLHTALRTREQQVR
ncbi:hypothetical protein AOLI_G00272820 [Acnodon oligacanthus]